MNTDSVKATGNTSTKQAGRIVGKDNSATLSNNYASTKIKLTKGDNTAFPTTDIAADAINGADTYLDEVAAVIADWTGEGKAFTAIDTTAQTGLLPRLKVITDYNDDGLPTAYEESSFIPGQPENLASSTYLSLLDPLSLSSNETTGITLSCSDGKWSYQKEEGGTSTRFNGTVKMGENVATSTNKLVIAATTGNPTLIFEKVEIKPTGAAALTIAAGCELTLNTTGEGTSTLSASGASTLVNKGSLTLTGKGLYIGNTSATDTHYGLDNSGSFTMTDPTATSVTFHCAGTAIHNTGTLGNTWMEWRFAATTGTNNRNGNDTNDAKIAFAATDAADQSPDGLLRQGKTYAATVTAGKTYRLWTVTNGNGNNTEVRTRQQGKMASGSPVVYFQAPAGNGVAVFTDMKDAVPVTVTQPTEGGTISVFSGDSLVAKADTIANGAELTLKSYPLPGYELESFTINGNADNTANSNLSNKYTVPADATSVTVTASFKAKAAAADTTQVVIVGKVDDLPEKPVEKPTAVIDKGNTTASNSTGSEVKLITGKLEGEHETSVKTTLDQVASGIDESNIIFAEIALVEITTTSGSGSGQTTTMTPIQPKDGNTVHVVYPYPSGTDSKDSFVIVHLKTDGTTEVYRDVPDTAKGEKELKKTARGLEFDVDSFSPFGIAWKKAYTPPYVPPVTNYYTVTLPDVEGVTFSKKAGNYTVEEGYSLSFALTLQDGYELHSKPVVRTSRGEILEPRASDGKYVVRNVTEDIAVTVEGIVRNDDQPTANAAIASGTRVWAADGWLHLSLDSPARVCVVDMGGRVCLLFDVPAGETTRALRPGLYLVRLGEKGVFKVAVR